MTTRTFCNLRHRLRPMTALLAVFWLLESCYSWRAQRVFPAAAVQTHPEAPLRLTMLGGSHREVDLAHLLRDTVFAIDAISQRAVRIPVDSIVGVETSEFDAVKSVAFVGILVAAVVTIANAAQQPKSPPPPPPPTSSGGNCGNNCFASCPSVYSWDGQRWRLDSGTFGGAIAEAFQRTDVDNLIYATPEHGRLRLRVANDLQETDHVDALAVLAVDHPAGTTVAPDGSGRLHTLGRLQAPVAAFDDLGRDVLAKVSAVDDRAWESALIMRDTSRASELRDGITLSFVRPAGARRAHLVVDANATWWAAQLMKEFIEAHGSATQAWYDSLKASPQLAGATGMQLAREGFLSAALWDGARWQPAGLIWDAGPEISKQQVLELDLGALAGDTVRVRLESAPAFWHLDRVAMDFTADAPLHEQVLALRSARDQTGRDVAPLIAAEDHSYYTLETGDAAALEYDVPEGPAAGQERSFILRSTGWYRIRTDESRAPDVALLRAIQSDRLGISRAAVVRLNGRLEQLARGQW